MNTKEKNLKYMPGFLMVIGVSNLLLISLVAGMRVLFTADVSVFGVSVYDLLSLVEPYGKLIWEFGLVFLFGVLIVKGKRQQDGTLLLLWAFVIMEVQCIYYVSSNYYATMIDTMSDFAGTAAYVSFYAGTHVFKYVLMFMAIVLAIFATGVVLRDKVLLATAAVMGILYGMCFGIQTMPTIVLPGGSRIGIVVPAALFHMAQTLVVFLVGLYLKLFYQKRQLVSDKAADVSDSIYIEETENQTADNSEKIRNDRTQKRPKNKGKKHKNTKRKNRKRR